MLDGNQKNSRPVCAAKEGGYMEYLDLPGSVKTECLETPEQQSKFCALHKPRFIETDSADVSAQHKLAETLRRKKETRNSTFYEVPTCS